MQQSDSSRKISVESNGRSFNWLTWPFTFFKFATKLSWNLSGLENLTFRNSDGDPRKYPKLFLWNSLASFLLGLLSSQIITNSRNFINLEARGCVNFLFKVVETLQTLNLYTTCNSFLLRLTPDIATLTITNSLWVANISREFSLMICEIITTELVQKRFIITNRKNTFPKCELLWSEENRTTGHWPNQRVGCH